MGTHGFADDRRLRAGASHAAVSPAGPDPALASVPDPSHQTYLARALILATLPHSRPVRRDPAGVPLRDPGGRIVEAIDWERVNGHYRLRIQADPELGLPFGAYPRLVLAGITREVKRRRSRTIPLGQLYPFLRQLGVSPGGNTARQVVNQVERLVGARMSFEWRGEDEDGEINRRHYVQVATSLELWKPRVRRAGPGGDLLPGVVELSEEFFRELEAFAVPLDLRIIARIKSSPLALDLYAWLTYRAFRVRRPTAVPWEALERQFGAEYAHRRDFRLRVRRALARILALYSDLRVELTREAVRLLPSRPSVRPRPAERR